MTIKPVIAVVVTVMLVSAACEGSLDPTAGKKAPDRYAAAPDACEAIPADVVQAVLGTGAKPEDDAPRMDTDKCKWERDTQAAANAKAQWIFLSADFNLHENDSTSSGEERAKNTFSGMRSGQSLGTCTVASGDCFYQVSYATASSRVNPAQLTVVIRKHNIVASALLTGQNFHESQKSLVESDAVRLATALGARLN